VEPPSIAGYELLRSLARGPAGETWVAQDARGGECVVKWFRERSAKSDEIIAFTSRASAMASLGHPNIARVADRGRCGEFLYTAREYFAGSLATLAPRLEAADKLRVGVDVGRALEYAHRHGLVHASVKPENVLFSESQRVALVDFTLGPLKLSEFTPPELRSSSRFDALSDQYSLAALVAWLLLGHLPAAGEPIGSDPDLDRALRAALSPFPSERFRRLDQLLEALDLERRRSVSQPAGPFAVRIERSTVAIRVHISGRWTAESVDACV
jgi:serine/threonine protein kinase